MFLCFLWESNKLLINLINLRKRRSQTLMTQEGAVLLKKMFSFFQESKILFNIFGGQLLFNIFGGQLSKLYDLIF